MSALPPCLGASRSHGFQKLLRKLALDVHAVVGALDLCDLTTVS